MNFYQRDYYQSVKHERVVHNLEKQRDLLIKQRKSWMARALKAEKAALILAQLLDERPTVYGL